MGSSHKIYFNFWNLVPKMYFFEFSTFFVVLYLSSQLNLPVIVRMWEIRVFVVSASAAMITGIASFSCFRSYHYKVEKFLQPINNFTVSLATKLGRMVSYLDCLPSIKLLNPLVTWSYKFTWQIKAIMIYQIWQVDELSCRPPI